MMMTLTTAQAAMYVETDALQHAAQARAAFELAAASMGSLSRQASTVSSTSSLTSPLISTRSAVSRASNEPSQSLKLHSH